MQRDMFQGQAKQTKPNPGTYSAKLSPATQRYARSLGMVAIKLMTGFAQQRAPAGKYL